MNSYKKKRERASRFNVVIIALIWDVDALVLAEFKISRTWATCPSASTSISTVKVS